MPYLDIYRADEIQYIPRNMHTVFALLCFVVVIHWLIFPYPSGLLHWHCGNLTIAPVPAKQPWWIWINTSCGFIMNDCITKTKQSTTKPCAYFFGYTVVIGNRGVLHYLSILLFFFVKYKQQYCQCLLHACLSKAVFICIVLMSKRQAICDKSFRNHWLPSVNAVGGLGVPLSKLLEISVGVPKLQGNVSVTQYNLLLSVELKIRKSCLIN